MSFFPTPTRLQYVKRNNAFTPSPSMTDITHARILKLSADTLTHSDHHITPAHLWNLFFTGTVVHNLLVDNPDHHNTPSRHRFKFYERGKIDVIEKHLCKSNFSNPINKKANFHCFTSQDNLAILYMLQPPRKTVANVQHKRPLERTNR